ncbi:MAG TPA: glycerophosphodiester phosphodiesterase family protein [Mycobacteriales bacterium]|nr:glycerophosphodiester phosphodiesterase family protein [Mycobacteriales bacterium]
MGSSPLVVAHRGSSFKHPEHTLAAYAEAVAEGADGLECDVRLTRDGHLVCVHDRRVERTSDGRGIVSEKSLADLADLDFGSWHQDLPDSADDLMAAEADPSGRDVLTLERLLEVVVDAPRLTRLFVETKHPTRYGGLVEQQLVRLLRRFGLAAPADRDESVVTVMSFAPAGVRRVRLLAPAVPTVLLLNRVPPFRRDGSLPSGATWAGPGLHILRAHPGYVDRVHALGGRVYVWTVDEAADIELVLSLRVDAIATNRPHDVLAKLGR